MLRPRRRDRRTRQDIFPAVAIGPLRKKRLAGDTSRSATSDEVKALRKESRDLKEALADLTLENRLLKKSMIGHGGDEE